MDTSTLISTAVILLYLLTAGWLGIRIFRLRLTAEAFNHAIAALAGLALSGHGLVLYREILVEAGFNLGFFHALSLVCWVIALLAVLIGLYRAMSNLVVIFFPVAALALLLESILPGTSIIPGGVAAGLKMHIILSVAAYSLLTIGALQALVLAFEETRLRTRQPVKIMNILPPMQTLEELLVQILTIGFFLLSLSLATGLMFMHDMLGQHLSHKVVLFRAGVVNFCRCSLGKMGPRLARPQTDPLDHRRLCLPATGVFRLETRPGTHSASSLTFSG